jgi:hypothetical protein
MLLQLLKNKQLISNTYPPGLTTSSPTIDITTSLDYPSFSKLGLITVGLFYRNIILMYNKIFGYRIETYLKRNLVKYSYAQKALCALTVLFGSTFQRLLLLILL